LKPLVPFLTAIVYNAGSRRREPALLATEGANSHKRSGTQDCDSKTFAIWRAVLRHPPKEQAGHTYVSGQTLRYRGQGEGHRLSLELCVLTTVYLIAITAEAMSGALAAGKRQMDMFGVVLIAFITALGGGTVRDMLLGNFPVNWTQHPSYIYLTITAGLMTMVVARFMHRLQQLFLILDAMGLVAFTIIGCNVALALNYDLPVVIMSGVITGIFGGILRDILCNQTPQVLQKELYASVSLLVAGLYLTLHDAGFDHDLTLLASFSCGLALRLIAIRWQLSLPVFSYSPERWQD